MIRLYQRRCVIDSSCRACSGHDEDRESSSGNVGISGGLGISAIDGRNIRSDSAIICLLSSSASADCISVARSKFGAVDGGIDLGFEIVETVTVRGQLVMLAPQGPGAVFATRSTSSAAR